MVKRVFIPFLAAMVVLTLFVFWRASRITSNLVENEYWKQMDRIAELLVEHPYLLSPTIHSQLEELVGAKIGYYDKKGIPHVQPRLPAHLDDSSAYWPVLSDETMDTIARSQTPLLLAPATPTNDSMILFSKIMSASDQNFVLGLMVPAGPRHELQKNLFLALAANVALSLLLILVLTFSFSKFFSRQLNNLLTIMEKIAEGKLQQQVPENGSPEWRRLATAFNRMTSRLQQYQQRLRASERSAAVGELSAVLAHEVRNPLTSLKMLGQVLRTRHAGESATVQLIDPMLSEVDRIDRLVQSILEWSRPSPPQLEQVDINILTSEVLGLMTPVFSRSGVEVIWQPGDIDTVLADQAQIKQVLWNLLKNAENVSTKGDKIRVTTAMDHGTMLRLLIDDQGPGLDENHKEKIYEPFYTTRAKGLGLGLTISKRIIERHGGRLLLENREQGGARAIVSLPTKQEKLPPIEQEMAVTKKE